jgi:AraC-like DNA-binding protein
MTMFATFTAAILFALLALSLFFVESAQSRPNKFLALLFALFSVHMMLLTQRYWAGRPDAFGLFSVIATCIGPTIYTYFVAVLKDQAFDAYYILRHTCLVFGMTLLQFYDAGFPVLKDIVVLASLMFYTGLCIRTLSEERITTSLKTDNASNVFSFLKFLIGFLLILAVVDLLILFEFVWLKELRPQITLTIGTILLTALSLAATYVGLNRNEFVAWIFAKRLSKTLAEGDLSALEKNSAIESLNGLIENEKIHLSPDTSIKSTAVMMGISARVLSQAVNQSYGKTFRRYINDLRIEAAKERLLKTEDKVLAIMFDVGFSTKSNFNKEFAQSVGLSPVDFRKAARLEDDK